MNSKIYAPSIYLFAYQEAASNSRNIYKKCQDILDKLTVYNFDLLGKINIDYYPELPQVNLLVKTNSKNKYNSLLPESLKFEGKVFLETKNYNFHGFTYPLRIDDTYILGLQASRPYQEYGEKTENSDTILLSKLNADNCFLPELNESSIHQTILITAWLPEDRSQRDWKYLQLLAEGKIVAEKVANDCVKDFLHLSDNQTNNTILNLVSNQINSSQSPQAYSQDILLGSSIFEYRIPREEGNFIHILVWLFSEKEVENILLDYYKDFLLLFVTQRQIFQAYYQSRCHYNLLQDYQQEIYSFNLELLQLDENNSQSQQYEHQVKKMMELSRGYHIELQNFKQQQYIIEADARKYESILNSLQKKLSIRPNRKNFVVKDQLSEFSFLTNGIREFDDYVYRLKADYDYFAISSSLLNQMLSGIDSLLTISQIATVYQIKDSQIKDSQIKDSQIKDFQIATLNQIQEILQIKDSQIKDFQIATLNQMQEILKILESREVTTKNLLSSQEILVEIEKEGLTFARSAISQADAKGVSRHLGNTIIIVGTGVAATQLTTTVIPQFLTPTEKSNTNQSLPNSIFIITLSIIIGIFCGYVASWLLKIKD
jgi:hypothetical protein